MSDLRRRVEGDLKPQIEELIDEQVRSARHEIRTNGKTEWGVGVIRGFADRGHESALEAADELGVEMAAAEQNPEANATAVGGRPDDPYDRNKSLDERMKKHVAWGPGNDDSPYNDDGPSPSANAAGGAGDVGPSTGGGSFEDFLHSNAAADPTGSENVRDVRLVDDPSNGERVRMIDAREAGDGASTGAERVRLVDINDEPEAAVDADPVYVDNDTESAGTFASYNAQPDATLMPVNPEKLG